MDIGFTASGVPFALVGMLTLFLSPSSILLAQKANLSFDHLTGEQGLSDNAVYAIIQDHEGFMWFGTSDGLNRFDGYTFTKFRHDPLDANSIPDSNVPRVYEDKSGILWTRSPDGRLCEFDRMRERFTLCMDGVSVPDMYEDSSGTLWFATQGRGLNRFDRKHDYFARCGTGSDSLTSVWGDRAAAGVLWLGTTHGLERYEQATERTVGYELGPGFSVNTIRGDRGGDLWIGTSKGLCSFDTARKTFSIFPFGGYEPKIKEGRGIQNILEDSKGILWVSTVSRLATFDRLRGTFWEHRIGRNAQNSISDIEITCIREITGGALWVATSGQGIGLFDRVAQKFTWYTNNPKDPLSLSDDNVHTAYQDRSGSIWFGTESGLNKLDRARKDFTSYTQDPSNSGSLSHKMVTGFSEDPLGALWVSTLGGLNRFNRETGTFTHFGHHSGRPQSLCSDRLSTVFADSKGGVWIGSLGHGLDRLDPANGRIRHYAHETHNINSLANDLVLSLLEDTSGKIWIGMSGGVLDEFDEESGEFVHYFQDRRDSTTLAGDWVSAIHQDRLGTIWVGTRGGGGLNRLDKASSKFTHIRSDPQSANGLSGSSVHSICEDRKSNLWIGTSAGLDMLLRPEGAIRHFTTKDGISNDHIGGILEDNGGSLWLHTNLGLSKFNPATGKIRNYGVSDGINIMQGWDQSYYKDKRGEMYFGGTNGFLRFHPDSIKDNPFVPPIVITAFRKFDKPVSLDSAISEKHSLEISYKENVFSFEFAALNYSSPEKNQYAYRLDGFDSDWVYCGTRRYATYTNLDGGTYVFRVKGSNNDGVWNEAGTSIAVVITPPFWKAWWFTILLWIAGACSIGGTVRYVEIRTMRQQMRLVEQQRALERERLRISSDLHDELASNLSSIAMLSKIAQNGFVGGSEGSSRRDQLLGRITALSQESVNSIRDIIWAIDSRTETLEGLLTRLSDMIIVACRAKNIHPQVTMPVTNLLPSTNLPPEVRQHLWLLLKEAVNNALKHSGCTELSLCVEYCGGELKIMVKDNGSGIDRLTAAKGRGMGTMKMRAEKLGAQLEQSSAPACGTEITLLMRV